MDQHLVSSADTAPQTSLWQIELIRADNAEAVLRTVQDYVVLWRPDELAELPEGCVPNRFSQPDDVREYADRIASQAPSHASPARQKLAPFFAVAARRLAELQQQDAKAF